MQVSDSSPWRLVFTALQDVRMPLFTVISGYVYAARPVDDVHQLSSLSKAKVRRCLVPLVVVGTLLFWVKYFIPGTNTQSELQDFWRPYVYGVDHLWFLQSIFSIFLIVGVMSISGLLATKRSWLIVTSVAFVVFILVPVPESVNIFSLAGTERLLPFFLLGYGIREFGFGIVQGRSAALTAGVFLLAYLPRMANIQGVWDANGQIERALAIVVGVCVIVCLFSYRSKLANRTMAWIGTFSFGIYLLHFFAYSGVRISLQALNISNHSVIFVLGVGLGVGLPIVFQYVSRNQPRVRMLFLGESR